MEDCCAVCAEPLEWVGYGPCGHQEVCSMCIARLRFVLNDKRCCICKQECPSVFVTKALGDYTKLIGDFESLAERGDLWYESNTQAYFDDEEQYKTMKAMCRLFCSVCEQAEGSGKESVKKGYVFRNLDVLRRHFLHSHKLQMCELCLEGRKVFICEQKLYNRAQLERHASKGDSEVDGNDEERGGFSGHPICDFCRRRFYGDNELYQHMSMDHYTCHICQRLRPGRFDYYLNYDDLEAHFRYEHALCEHPECLAKKFVVFTSDAELKRHNALVHGGSMSRAQRNAALQIPVSFQYRRPGQERGGEGPSRRRGYLNGQGSAGRHANIDLSNVEHAVHESLVLVSDTDSASHTRSTAERNLPDSSGTPSVLGDQESETGANSSGNEPSRYLTAVSGAGPSSLQESAFPPLPGSKNARRKAKQRTRGSAVSMAALLAGGERRIRVLNATELSQRRRLEWESHVSESALSNHVSQGLARGRHIENLGMNRQTDSAVGGPGLPLASGEGGLLGAVFPVAEEGNGSVIQLSVEELRTANKALVECIRTGLKGDEEQFNAFKDVSSQFRKGEINAKVYYKHIVGFGLSHLVPELARLCPDPEKQNDLLDAHQEGLNSKGPKALEQPFPTLTEGARNGNVAGRGKGPSKTDTLGETETPGETSVRSSVGATAGLRLTDRGGTYDDAEVEVLSKDGYRDEKGKKKLAEPSSSKSTINARSPSLGKASSGHSKPAKVLVKATQPLGVPSSLSEPVATTRMDGAWACSACTLENKEGSSHCAACGVACPDINSAKQDEAGGNEKRKKKSSKFQRVRLGNGSAASLLDSSRQNPWGSALGGNGAGMSNPPHPGGNSFGRGVWKNGGGQRLVSLSQRESIIESAWDTK